MSVDGTWNITMKTPMGDQASVLTLATAGGTLTGSMSGPTGDLDIEDGTVDGNKLAWVTNVTSPMKIEVKSTATIDGDSIEGEAELGTFGKATFSGSRG